jgi:hypothetical protein
MPDPSRLLRTLHQAARLFRETPGRRGRLVALAGVEDVLVGGDLHGNVGNFRLLMERADLRAHPDRHLVLQEVVHGAIEYAAGGDKSHQLLDLLAALKIQFPRQVHMLLGNHELAQWTDRWIAKGESNLIVRFRQGVRTAYGPRADDIYGAYLDLFASLPVALRTPNRVFLSHSLPRVSLLERFDVSILEQDAVNRSELLPGGTLHALVWGRDTALEHVVAFLQKVDADLLITGHIPAEGGFDVPNDRQIILDSLGEKAGCCLFPTNRPLTHAELVSCVQVLSAGGQDDTP